MKQRLKIRQGAMVFNLSFHTENLKFHTFHTICYFSATGHDYKCSTFPHIFRVCVTTGNNQYDDTNGIFVGYVRLL